MMSLCAYLCVFTCQRIDQEGRPETFLKLCVWPNIRSNKFYGFETDCTDRFLKLVERNFYGKKFLWQDQLHKIHEINFLQNFLALR